MKTLPVVSAIVFALATDLSAQVLSGTVWDTLSNSRVAAARVVLLQVDSSQSVITDSTGRFHFRALPGMASLRVSGLGYSDIGSRTFIVEKDAVYSLLIYMSTTPIDVMPIHVIAKSRRAATPLELFEQRRKSSGAGYFLDSKALARVYATEASDFLRRVPGVIVEQNFVRLRQYCGEPIFIVDGIEFRPPEYEDAPRATEVVNSLLNPNDIAAIEVYKDVAPPELQSGLALNWACGAVVIWTKQRSP